MRGRGVALRTWILLAAVLLAAACTTTRFIKFPAEEYLVRHFKERLRIENETFYARRRCDALQTGAAPLAPMTGVPVNVPVPKDPDRMRAQCSMLADRMKELEAWDLAVIRASLKGDTIDPATIQLTQALLGPLLAIAKDIAIAP